MQKTIRSRSSRARNLLPHRPQEHLWHKLLDLHHQLGDREDGPFRGLQGAAEEIVEVNDDKNEVVGDLNAPNKDTNTIVKVVVTGEHVTIPSDLKEKSSLKVH